MTNYEVEKANADRINREIKEFIGEGCDDQDFFRFIMEKQIIERMQEDNKK